MDGICTHFAHSLLTWTRRCIRDDTVNWRMYAVQLQVQPQWRSVLKELSKEVFVHFQTDLWLNTVKLHVFNIDIILMSLSWDQAIWF